MKNSITIARKELFSYINNPTAYVVVAAFLLLWEFIFFRNVFLIGEVSLDSLFEFLPWILMIVVPALTMGSVAEEKSEGTLEFLLTHPVSQLELVAGKFIGIAAFFAAALLFIFPLAWSFNHFGSLDFGKVFGQYLGSLSLAALFVALGILVSSFFSSQISAFLISAVANFLLIVVGTEFFSNHFPLSISSFIDQLSVTNHFNSMSRGVIDARDVWYFVSLIGIFLGFTYLNLIRNKYGNKKVVYRNYQLGSVLMLGIVILSNIVGSRIPGRIDLTKDQVYTLSAPTKAIVGGLSDIVSIHFYASDQLPAQLQPTLREAKDMLEDYRKASQGKIRVSYVNPSDDEVKKEAAAQGIQPMRFNVVSQEEFQVKEGYLGIAITYGAKTETIPYVDKIDDLEYNLTSLIKKLTTEQKPKIGVISGHGEKSLAADYAVLNTELRKQFDIVDIAAQGGSSAPSAPEKNVKNPKAPKAPADTNQPKKITIPEGVKTVLIANPTENYSDDERATLADFLKSGGSAMFLVEGATVSAQTLSATASTNNLIDFIKDQTGVEIAKNLVYDLRSNEAVGFTSGANRFVLPYPFWIRGLKVESGSPIVAKLDSATFSWASSLAIDESAVASKGFERTDIFTTSEAAGSQASNFTLSPDQNFSSNGLDKKVLAVALAPKEGSGKTGRIIVAGDSDLLSDQAVKSNPSNFGFGMEGLSWLTQESSLSQIKTKNIANRKFLFSSDSDPLLLEYGNLGFVLVSISGYGFWRLYTRKRKKEQVYQD